MKRRLIAAAAVAALLASAPAAWAHVELKSVSPGKHATRHGAVREVHATFRSSLVTGLMTIKTSSGRVVALRRAGLKAGDRRLLEAIPRSPLGSGRYTVEWRARAPDGHSQRGSWSFRVRG